MVTREGGDDIKEGGVRVHLSPNGAGLDHFSTALEGPENDLVEGNYTLPVIRTLDAPGGDELRHLLGAPLTPEERERSDDAADHPVSL